MNSELRNYRYTEACFFIYIYNFTLQKDHKLFFEQWDLYNVRFNKDLRTRDAAPRWSTIHGGTMNCNVSCVLFDNTQTYLRTIIKTASGSWNTNYPINIARAYCKELFSCIFCSVMFSQLYLICRYQARKGSRFISAWNRFIAEFNDTVLEWFKLIYNCI